MRLLLIASIFCVASSAVFAQGGVKSCSAIDDSLKRLNCYDSYLRPSTPRSAETTAKIMTFVDFVTDFKSLVGKEVKVKGFGLMLGENLIVYQELGSLNGFFVKIDQLSRDNMRELLTRCGSGCEVTVSGVARKVMMQHGIVARSVSFD